MKPGAIIKKIREDKGLLQKEVSSYLGIGNSNYNKLENEHRDLSIEELQKLSILFNMTTDEILNYGRVVPKEIKVADKPDLEKLHLINQLKEEDKKTVFNIIDTMLTKQRFQDFFEQNLQIK